MRGSPRACPRSSRCAGKWAASCSPVRRRGPAAAATKSSACGTRARTSEDEAEADEDAAAADLEFLVVAVPRGSVEQLVLEVQADAFAEADVRARHALEG